MVPTSGTTIKLSWKLPDDAKKDGWIYAIYYGMTMTEIISEGPRFNTYVHFYPFSHQGGLDLIPFKNRVFYHISYTSYFL